MIGERVSKYSIVRKLGEGGMGEVYLADDTTLDRRVALKFLPPDQERDPLLRQRFLREARVVAAISHPFICAIHDVVEEDGRTFLALEYVEGPTLKSRIAKGPLPMTEVLEIASEIAEALERAHNAGIFHRDLKPSNIMFTPEGHVKVMDFGLAKQTDAADSGSEENTLTVLTTESSVMGTPSYMSPEQLVGDPLDKRTDIFSFGILLYEMLAGTHPFRRKTMVATTQAIIAKPPPPLADHDVETPEVLQHTVSKMLAKDVAKRYQSVHEVATNLRELLNQDMTQTGPFSGVYRAPRRNRRVVWWLAAAAAALAVGLGGRWLASDRPAAETPTRAATELAVPEVPRLAVLPFSNMSGRADDESFSDGLTESLISRLARIPSWQVISRTSTMQFKGTDTPIPTIAAQLGVDYVLEGSLLKEGERCLVRAQLIRTSDDVTVWNEEYPLAWTDIFDVQQQVSTAVAAELHLTLRPETQARLARVPTEVIEAYNAYLKASHNQRLFTSRLDMAHAEEAERQYQAALELDPDYVEAMAGLGYLYFSVWDHFGDEEWLDKSEAVLGRALELDAENLETNVALTALRAARSDVYGALELAWRVLESNPNSSAGHRNLANLYFFKLGLYEAAIEQYEKTIEVDPLVLAPYANAALALSWVGRRDDALAELEKLRRIDPNWAYLRYYKGSVLLADGDLDAAAAEFAAGLGADRAEIAPYLETGLAIVAAARGDLAAASKTVETYRETPQIRNAFFAEPFALLAWMTGEVDLAVEVRAVKLWSSYRKDVLDLEFVKRFAAASFGGLRTDPRLERALTASWEAWEASTARAELESHLQPPRLAPPDRLLR